MEHRKLIGNTKFDLCIQFQPTLSYFNWILVGYASQADKKIFYKSYTYYPKILDQDKYKYYNYETYDFDEIENLFKE